MERERKEGTGGGRGGGRRGLGLRSEDSRRDINETKCFLAVQILEIPTVGGKERRRDEKERRAEEQKRNRWYLESQKSWS